jgi:hypothetical protein
LQEEIEPLRMLGEGQFDLNLLSGRDATVEGPRIFHNPVHVLVIFLRNRIGELPTHKKMRQIRKQRQARKPVHQIERKVEVGCHSVAMGLDKDGNTCLPAKFHPTLEQRHALINLARPSVRLKNSRTAARSVQCALTPLNPADAILRTASEVVSSGAWALRNCIAHID